MYEVFHNTSYIYITANILHIHKMHIYRERDVDALRDLLSVTIWRLHGCSNTYKCMATHGMLWR